jgi:hypothetical protein
MLQKANMPKVDSISGSSQSTIELGVAVPAASRAIPFSLPPSPSATFEWHFHQGVTHPRKDRTTRSKRKKSWNALCSIVRWATWEDEESFTIQHNVALSGGEGLW